MQSVSLTALMSAFGRAYFSPRATPLDRELLTPEELDELGNHVLEGLSFFEPERVGTFGSDAAALDFLMAHHICPNPVMRARFTKERLALAQEQGVDQYVLLGAGLDTYALRHAGEGGLRTFEIDLPATQEDKLARIADAGLDLPECLTFVAADLSGGTWPDALLAAGFDPHKPAFFAWLDVSYYLEEAAIESMLAHLAQLAAPGSRLVFDHADENLFTSDDQHIRCMLAMAAAAGEPMKSCFSREALAALLTRHGFSLTTHLSSEDVLPYLSGTPARPIPHICLAEAIACSTHPGHS